MDRPIHHPLHSLLLEIQVLMLAVYKVLKVQTDELGCGFWKAIGSTQCWFAPELASGHNQVPTFTGVGHRVRSQVVGWYVNNSTADLHVCTYVICTTPVSAGAQGRS